MLIAVLLRKPWRAEWQPPKWSASLGYTAMTLSRAVKELTAAGIATLRTEGRARWLQIERTAAETWEHAKPCCAVPSGADSGRSPFPTGSRRTSGWRV